MAALTASWQRDSARGRTERRRRSDGGLVGRVAAGSCLSMCLSLESPVAGRGGGAAAQARAQ